MEAQMNVFATDTDPMVAATHLSDQHVRSQLGETARILSTALHMQGLGGGPLLEQPYKQEGCVPQDGCCKFPAWAASSWDNFFWLVFYGMALVEEHEFRFREIHPATASILACGGVARLIVLQRHQEIHEPSVWPRCEAAMGFEDLDTHKAYRNVLRAQYDAGAKNGSRPTWTRCDPPFWLAA